MRGDVAEGNAGALRLTLADDRAVDDVKVFGAGLHEMRGHLQRLVAGLARGNGSGVGGHDGGASRVRADAVFDTIGAAMYHAHFAVIAAEHVSTDLRDHRLEALADGRAARDHLDAAAGI